MLPNIINVLTYHELTNENTLLLLKKKINELKTFDEQGNKNILNDDDRYCIVCNDILLILHTSSNCVVIKLSYNNYMMCCYIAIYTI